MTRIAIIQGHPTQGGSHFCHALADGYARGALENGREVRRIPVAELEFPLVRSKEEWEQSPPPPSIVQAQQTILWAEHLVIVYPLWLGSMPALLKGFLEQALRPAFMAGEAGAKVGTGWKSVLKGRSARVVLTMGMPALIYRWYFGAHSLKSLERNILSFAGIRPNRHTLIGMVEGISDTKRQAWLERIRGLGAKAR